jgi:hypothetical protein
MERLLMGGISNTFFFVRLGKERFLFANEK